MVIRIRFFASLRDKIGRDELIIEKEAYKIPLHQLFNELKREYPEIPENILIAVNHEYRSLDYMVKDKDEIAFITPVSGGLDV